jgi:hypothetical protein
MKNDKVIMVGIGSREGMGELDQDLEMAEEADASLYESLAPKGDFTSRGLDPLVKSVNLVLPLFEQEPTYPKVKDTKLLPVDFVRILSMFAAAVDDAIEAEVLAPEMKISLDGIRDDSALMSLAGKLQMISKDKAFKAFLKEEVEEIGAEEEGGEEEEMMEEGGEEMSEEDLLMSRM